MNFIVELYKNCWISLGDFGCTGQLKWAYVYKSYEEARMALSCRRNSTGQKYNDAKIVSLDITAKLKETDTMTKYIIRMSEHPLIEVDQEIGTSASQAITELAAIRKFIDDELGITAEDDIIDVLSRCFESEADNRRYFCNIEQVITEELGVSGDGLQYINQLRERLRQLVDKYELKDEELDKFKTALTESRNYVDYCCNALPDDFSPLGVLHGIQAMGAEIVKLRTSDKHAPITDEQTKSVVDEIRRQATCGFKPNRDDLFRWLEVLQHTAVGLKDTRELLEQMRQRCYNAEKDRAHTLDERLNAERRVFTTDEELRKFKEGLLTAQEELSRVTQQYKVQLEDNAKLSGMIRDLKAKPAHVVDAEIALVLEEMRDGNGPSINPTYYDRKVAKNWHDTIQRLGAEVVTLREAVSAKDTVQSDHERLLELANRLILPGPKADHLSASECHELAESVINLVKTIDNWPSTASIADEKIAKLLTELKYYIHIAGDGQVGAFQQRCYNTILAINTECTVLRESLSQMTSDRNNIAQISELRLDDWHRAVKERDDSNQACNSLEAKLERMRLAMRTAKTIFDEASTVWAGE